MQILIIDYAATFADEVAFFFQEEGWSCKATYTFRTGWEYIYGHADEISLVLLNAAMSQYQVTAGDFLNEVKLYFPHLPVVLMNSRLHPSQTSEIAADGVVFKEELGTFTVLSALLLLIEKFESKQQGPSLAKGYE